MNNSIKNFSQSLKKRKNKASLVFTSIFLALIVFSLFMFIGNYLLGDRVGPGFLKVSGRVEGYEYHASSRVPGKVVEMFVDEGDKVEVGQPIARIEAKQLEAALKRAEAMLAEAESNFHLAEIEYHRYGRLAKGNAVPKMEYKRATRAYQVAEEQVEAARQVVEKSKADLEDSTIVAPISGTVVIKVVRLGEVVAIGTPIVTLINMDDLFLKIFLATPVAGKVNLGNEARVYPDALPKEAFEAVVNKIAGKAQFTPKNVETKSQRAKLVFEMKLKIKENPGHKLKPGMPSSAVIKIDDQASWKSEKKS